MQLCCNPISSCSMHIALTLMIVCSPSSCTDTSPFLKYCRYYQASPLESWLKKAYGFDMTVPTVAYAPNTAETKMVVETYLAEQMTNTLGLVGSMSLRFKGYDNETVIENMHSKTPVAAAIIFKSGSEEGSALGLSADMTNVNYVIRMAPDLPETSSWLTTAIFPSSMGTKPKRDANIPYMSGGAHNGFLFLQAGVERALARHFHPTKLPPAVYARLKAFPYPKFTEYSFISLSNALISLFVVQISMFVAAFFMISDVVSEKKERQKEVMKMMGASSWEIWLSWILKWLVQLGLVSALLTIILFMLPFERRVFKYSSGGLFFLLFLSYSYCCMAFSFFISTIFQEPTVASIAGIVFLYVSYIPWDQLSQPSDWNTGERPFDDLAFGAKSGLSLAPVSACAMAIDIFGRYEIKGQSASFGNSGRGPDENEDFGVGHIIGMLWAGTAIWTVLAWYCDNVIQGEFGTAKGYLFFLGCGKSSEAQVHETSSLAKPENNVGIKISHVVKTWNTPEGPKKAVDDLNLDVNKGEITVLLGHNGAGKTTAMSIMCGMYPPTAGAVFINGHNVSTDMDQARESLGLCPQFDIIWKNLTVRQHLELYCKLKGVDDSAFIEKEVATFLVDLNLKDKENERAHTLSGGQKRCLSCSIALIGGSKTVILDEPTSGMDPEKRRMTWKLIAKHREGRTILLTTHFMDEADLLGDRIAIMHHGALAAAGSSLELKKTYGSGYKLTVAKKDPKTFDDAGVSKLVTSAVEGATVVSNSLDSELCYNLPDASVTKFPAMFKALEAADAALGVANYGVSCTTMEEVFLRVGDEGLPEGNEALGMEDNEFLLGSNRQEDGVGIDSEKEVGCSLWSQQFRALFYKRVINAKRNPWATALTIGMPVLLILVGFLTSMSSGGEFEAVTSSCRSLAFDEFTPTQTVYLSGDDKDYDKFADMQPPVAAAEAAFSTVPVTQTETDLFNAAKQYVTDKSITLADFTGESFSDSLLTAFDNFTETLALEKDKLGATFGQGITWITKVDGMGCQSSSYPEVSTGSPKVSAPFAANEIKLKPDVWYSFGFDPTLNPSTSPTCFTGPCIGAEASLKSAVGDELWTTGEEYRSGDVIDASNVPPGVQIVGHMGFTSFNITKFQADQAEEDEENSATQNSKEQADAAFALSFASKVVGPSSRTPVVRIKFDADSASTLSLNCDGGSNVVISVANATAGSTDTVFVPPTTVAFGWHTRQMIHSSPEALNFIGNVIAKEHLDNPNVEFNVKNCPLPKSLQQQSIQLAAGGSAIGITILMIFGLSTFAGAVLLFPFAERKSHAKHVQFVSGANDFVYWLSSFCWDFILGLAMAVLCTIVAAAVNLDSFSGPLIGYFFVTLIVAIWAVIPLVYIAATTMPVESKATAFALLFFALYMVSLISFFVILFVGLFTENEVTRERIDKANIGMMINPVYAFAKAVYTMMNNKAQLELVAQIEAEGFTLEALGIEIDYQRNYFAFGKGGIGNHTVFLAAGGIVYWIVLLLIEWSSRRQGTKSAPENTDFAGDDDVEGERHRIKTGSSTDVVVVKGISKKFGGGLTFNSDCGAISRERGCWKTWLYSCFTACFSRCVHKQEPNDAVKDLTFGIAAGECFGLLGVNGAGKTTTFEMLTGEKTLTTGSVQIRGMDIASNMQAIRQHIGYCPQYDGLVGSLTGREALSMFARLRGVPEEKIGALVESAVNALALKKFADQCCGTYSGGNKRKLSTAIAIIGAPDIIFLDEPTSGMDPKSRRYLWDVLLAIRRSGKIIVLTSHSMEECEALCTKVVIMKAGQFRCIGSPQHLKSKYGSGYTVTARLHAAANGSPSDTTALNAMFTTSFPEAVFEKDVYGEVSYTLPKHTPLSKLFDVLEAKKTPLSIEDYSVAQTSLEQVFLKFAEDGAVVKASAIASTINAQPDGEANVVLGDDGLVQVAKTAV